MSKARGQSAPNTLHSGIDKLTCRFRTVENRWRINWSIRAWKITSLSAAAGLSTVKSNG